MKKEIIKIKINTKKKVLKLKFSNKNDIKSLNIYESSAAKHKFNTENKLWSEGKTWPEEKVWTTQHCLPPAAIKHGLDHPIYRLDNLSLSSNSQKVKILHNFFFI